MNLHSSLMEGKLTHGMLITCCHVLGHVDHKTVCPDDGMDCSKKDDTYCYRIDEPVRYRCREFEVNQDHYSEWSDSEQTEDWHIEELVQRTILSIVYGGRFESSRTDNDRLMTDEEASRDLQTIQSPKDHRQRNARNRKQEKRPKKGKKEGFEYDNRLGIEPTLTVPMSNFRAMVKAEVESRARTVHNFYAYQWQNVQKERIHTYAELISARERENSLKDYLKQARDEINHQQEENERIRIELENIKNAKKRKKKDAKLRRIKDLQERVETVKCDREVQQEKEVEDRGDQQAEKQCPSLKVETGTTLLNISKETPTMCDENPPDGVTNKEVASRNETGKAAIELNNQENEVLDSYTPQTTAARKSEEDNKDSLGKYRTAGVSGIKKTCMPFEKTVSEEKFLASVEPGQGEPAQEIAKPKSPEINNQRTGNGDDNGLQYGNGDTGAKM